MKKKDLLFIGILFIGAIWVVLIPNSKNIYHQILPSELVYEISKDERYISTDDVAKFIIDKDPSILLVDVRTPEEYKEYSLQGALNIPYDSLLNESSKGLVNQDIYKIIFYSNGSSLADQAWLTCKRIGYDNNYVMKGGLNRWFQTIIRPIKPEEFALPEEFELYSFRKGASMFFGGGSTADKNGSEEVVEFEVQERAVSTNLGGCE